MEVAFASDAPHTYALWLLVMLFYIVLCTKVCLLRRLHWKTKTNWCSCSIFEWRCCASLSWSTIRPTQ